MAHGISAAGRHRAQLSATLAISCGLLVLEVAAGLMTGSLALLAEAGHVLADVSGLALSLAAVWLASRPRTTSRTFGLYRIEILAAAANALLLLGVAVAVLYEALRRLVAPPPVEAGIVTAVALVALVANGVSLRLLSKGRSESLIGRGAYLEVLGDFAGAAAVLVAGVIIATSGWRQADPLASIAIAILIVPRTLSLLRDSIDVLLEATPRAVDMDEVRRHILDAQGVEAVHDLHAWSITSGMNVLSAHVVLGPDGDPGTLLDHLSDCLSDDFDISHSTFQLETPEHVLWEGRTKRAQH